MAEGGKGELAGKQLGTYQLTELLGAGGMAEVYLARDLNLGRRVAVKILPRDLAADPGYVRRFREEARRVANLQHPHIIPIYYAGEQDGLLYMVMPVVQESLRGRMERRGTPTPDQAINLVQQIAGALSAAHQIGLIHRDVKPENILIDADGNAMLTDFGIAREVHRPTGDGKRTMQTMSASGLPVGTPEYMAPEQFLGGSVGPQADIYALGVVLYELLTGRTPREGHNPMEVAAQTLSRRPFTPPSERNPRVWPALNRAVMTALEHEPRDRFADMARFSYALGQSLTYRDEPAPPERHRTTNQLDDLEPPDRTSRSGQQSRPLDGDRGGLLTSGYEDLTRAGSPSRPLNPSRALNPSRPGLPSRAVNPTRPINPSRPMNPTHPTGTARPRGTSRPFNDAPTEYDMEPLREEPASRPVAMGPGGMATEPGALHSNVPQGWVAAYHHGRQRSGARRYWWIGLVAVLLLSVATAGLTGILHYQQAALPPLSSTASSRAGSPGGTATAHKGKSTPTAHSAHTGPLSTSEAATETASVQGTVLPTPTHTPRPTATATPVPPTPTPIPSLTFSPSSTSGSGPGDLTLGSRKSGNGSYYCQATLYIYNYSSLSRDWSFNTGPTSAAWSYSVHDENGSSTTFSQKLPNGTITADTDEWVVVTYTYPYGGTACTDSSVTSLASLDDAATGTTHSFTIWHH